MPLSKDEKRKFMNLFDSPAKKPKLSIDMASASVSDFLDDNIIQPNELLQQMIKQEVDEDLEQSETSQTYFDVSQELSQPHISFDDVNSSGLNYIVPGLEDLDMTSINVASFRKKVHLIKRKKEREAPGSSSSERVGWRKIYGELFTCIEESSNGNQYFRCITCNVDLVFGKMGKSAIKQHLDSGRHATSVRRLEEVGASTSAQSLGNEGELDALTSLFSKKSTKYSIPYYKFKQKYADYFPEITSSSQGHDYYYCKLCDMHLKCGTNGPTSIKQHINCNRHKQKLLEKSQSGNDEESSAINQEEVVGVSCVNFPVKSEVGEVLVNSQSESTNSSDFQDQSESAPMQTLSDAITTVLKNRSKTTPHEPLEETLKKRIEKTQLQLASPSKTSTKIGTETHPFNPTVSTTLASKLVTQLQQSAQEWKSKFENTQLQLVNAHKDMYRSKQEYYTSQQELLTTKQELDITKFEMSASQNKMQLIKSEILRDTPDLKTIRQLLTENFPLLPSKPEPSETSTKEILAFKQMVGQQTAVIKDLRAQLKYFKDDKIEAAKLIIDLQQSREEVERLKSEKSKSFDHMKQADDDFNDAIIEIDNLKLALASKDEALKAEIRARKKLEEELKRFKQEPKNGEDEISEFNV